MYKYFKTWASTPVYVYRLQSLHTYYYGTTVMLIHVSECTAQKPSGWVGTDPPWPKMSLAILERDWSTLRSSGEDSVARFRLARVKACWQKTVVKVLSWELEGVPSDRDLEALRKWYKRSLHYVSIHEKRYKLVEPLLLIQSHISWEPKELDVDPWNSMALLVWQNVDQIKVTDFEELYFMNFRLWDLLSWHNNGSMY